VGMGHLWGAKHFRSVLARHHRRGYARTGFQTAGDTALEAREAPSGRPGRRDRGTGTALGEFRRTAEHRDGLGTRRHRGGGFPNGHQLELGNLEGTRRVFLPGLGRLHHPAQLAGVLPIKRGPDGLPPIRLDRPLHQHRRPGERLETEPLEPERPAQETDDQDPVDAGHAARQR
jgi:hypothetical protein